MSSNVNLTQNNICNFSFEWLPDDTKQLHKVVKLVLHWSLRLKSQQYKTISSNKSMFWQVVAKTFDISIV